MELNKSIFRWLIIIIIILILALIGTNVGWFIYESQFETVTTDTDEYTQTVENIESVETITQTQTK